MLRRLSVLLVAALISCSSQVRKPESGVAARPGSDAAKQGSQVVLYARATRATTLPITWEIRKISLVKADGSQIDLPGSGASLNLGDLARDQHLVSISDAEAGGYTGLKVFTRKAFFTDTGSPVGIGSTITSVDHAISIVAGNAKTLTLVIDLPTSETAREHLAFAPALSIEDENPRPTGKVVYVSNQGSSTVSVIDKDLKRVVYNVFVGTRPSALSADRRRNRLYIADSRDGVIYEMDALSQHLNKATQIDFVDEPVHIETIPAKDLLIVVNYGTDTIYLVDSFTLQTIEQIEVGDGPVDAAYSPVFDLAFVLNSVYGAVSVLDMDTRPTEVDTTLQVELGPRGLAIDDAMGWLYISNGGSTDMSVIKIETLAIEKTITIGIGADDVVFDPFSRRVYVGMAESSEILCVDPHTGVVLYDVPLPSRPGKMLFDSDEKKLYVALPDQDALAVINPMSRKVEHWIGTGHEPSSIAIRF